MKKQKWYTCHKGCIYDAELADRQGRMRCVKHGAILEGSWQYEGKTREEIKAARKCTSCNMPHGGSGPRACAYII